MAPLVKALTLNLCVRDSSPSAYTAVSDQFAVSVFSLNLSNIPPHMPLAHGGGQENETKASEVCSAEKQNSLYHSSSVWSDFCFRWR